MMTKFDKLNIIGLTGMSGAGKSLAAGVFAEQGYLVIDCDGLARRIITGAKCAEAIKREFPEMYDEHGIFDRIRAAEIVFTSAAKLAQYERLIYPFIAYGVIRFIADAAAKGEKNFVLDAPTLYQSKANDLCRKIIAVVAEKTSCVKRITERDNIGEESAFMRLNSQPDAAFYRSAADFYVVNNHDVSSFTKSIKSILREIGV
jgi:dephospho-CoA kinase